MKLSLCSIVFRAVGRQRVALTSTVRENPSTPEAVLVPACVVAQPRARARPVGEFKIAAPWNVLGSRRRHKQQRAEHSEYGLHRPHCLGDELAAGAACVEIPFAIPLAPFRIRM